jgi:hypothetical protein
MDPVQELLAIEAIRRLKARYFRYLDTKRFEEWSLLFTADAVLTVDVGITTWGGDPAPTPALEGRQAILAEVSQRFPNTLTVHHGHMPEIDIIDEDHAEAIWALGDIVESRESARNGAGHYHEQYVREDGEWRIARLHLTRLRREEVFRTVPGA